ncbi:hypothetical protein V5O48_012525 [Marasmius crinis-equi]|uniref:Uncharacterized protein n=1 Tax=Marasmius crinis-equi TaxID=585013 RepID=A0ABR3F2M1_9AGAR
MLLNSTFQQYPSSDQLLDSLGGRAPSSTVIGTPPITSQEWSGVSGSVLSRREPDLMPDPPQSATLSPSSSPSPSPSKAQRNRTARTYIDGKRRTPKVDDPIWGLMKARKGSQPYDVMRTGALLGPVDRSVVNKRFNTNIQRILLKCEQLADETNCWLYIAASHPTVQGEYLHWTSPAIQQDLPARIVAHWDETSADIFRGLRTARRQDIVQVEIEAAQVRKERDVALEQAASQKSVVDKLIARLRASGQDLSDLTDADLSLQSL